MILSDVDLKQMIETKALVIEPINKDTIQQNGLDFTVNNEFAIGKQEPENKTIDSTSSDNIKKAFYISKDVSSFFICDPLKNYLFTTREVIKMPNNIMGFCGLRSTFARLGFISPLTVIDAGFEGTLTIGTFYGGSAPIKVPVGCRFLHVIFAKLLTEAETPYQGSYKGQKGVSLPKSLL
jgi:dCTP deaminase